MHKNIKFNEHLNLYFECFLSTSMKTNACYMEANCKKN